MILTEPPYSVSFDLGAVTDAGMERTLSPSADERHAIARWLGVESVMALTAVVCLKRRGEDHYLYEANFEADLVQACVVTLGPVPAHLSGEFHRDFRVRREKSAKRLKQIEQAPASVELTGLDDHESDWLDQHEIDLAAPVLEELALTIDPYPKVPGAEFELPAQIPDPRESPFAVLEKLKREAPPAAGEPKKPAAPDKTVQHTRKRK